MTIFYKHKCEVCEKLISEELKETRLMIPKRIQIKKQKKSENERSCNSNICMKKRVM